VLKRNEPLVVLLKAAGFDETGLTMTARQLAFTNFALDTNDSGTEFLIVNM
jgi:hypothetical protein